MTETSQRILVVDDDDWVLTSLRIVLQREGYEIDTSRNLPDFSRFGSPPIYDLVLCDVRLGDSDGREFLRQIKKQQNPPEVIMISGFPDVEIVVDVMRRGAYDFLSKPLRNERVIHAVNKALVRKRRQTKTYAPSGGRLVTNSPVMKDLMSIVKAVASTPATVLIEGESGTGKELVAQTIHRLSDRSGAPFMPVNCGALTETLLESELFGYVKGAFTGAVSDKKGLFESAGEGTVLLDEIGEMPLGLQTSLLRVLQDNKIRPVGSPSTKDIRCRIIATTNRSLWNMVDSGDFREDLYYRLCVVPIQVPPPS